jgi:hypothetical protein
MKPKTTPSAPPQFNPLRTSVNRHSMVKNKSGRRQLRPLLLCAQHGRWLKGERPLQRLIAPTVSGRQGRCREARSGGSRKQTCGLRNTKRVRGCPSRASWQQATKPNAIKGLGSKRDKRAEKVNVLTWGDLLPSRKATLLAKAG